MTIPKDEKPSNNGDQNPISRSTQAAYRQYDRLAEDWRFHHNLIWQIPSVAIAIIGGIVTVSYQFLNGLPRVILLSIGSALIFALTIALAKHRLGADARTQFLCDLGGDRPLDFSSMTLFLRHSICCPDFVLKVQEFPT
jgi:hypothetical protein